VDAWELGEAAWERFSAGPEDYDLVIVDLTLPDLPGETLLRRMLERSPGTPALICSGAPDPGMVADGERVHFLQKPFLPAMLAERVKSILGG
jgi:DNA-binding response OmpR family regulator